LINRRIWIVSGLYYPEDTSTGYYLTGIAEGLAPHRPVHVLCGQPTYGARGTRAPTRETRHGVSIRRCWGTTCNKDSLAGRLLNLLTLSLSLFFRALREIRRGDQVLVVTNPATVPFLIAIVTALKRARCALLVHDVYPEAIVAAGLLRPGSWAIRLLRGWSGWLLRRMDRIVVLGRDMETLVGAKAGPASSRIRIIPNWADVDDVAPEVKSENGLLNSLNLSGCFVAQYSGNMGRTHDIEGLVEAARRAPDVHFLFIGSGARRGSLESAVDRDGLRNITLLPARPRQELRTLLNACDVAIFSFVPGMAGISVPSRLYNILAAGKPIVAAVDEESEMARVVREENVGWVVPPGRPEQMAEALLLARSRPEVLFEMGVRARRAAEQYSRSRILESYAALFEGDHGSGLS
jgi:colanic acid biosynthesis glycosyl transferase WcaI